MKTCRDCKEIDCYRDQYADSAACEDFTSEAIGEEPVEFVVTPDAYKELKRMYGEACEEIKRLEARLDGYEKAVAGLVKWAQDDPR